MISDSEKNDLEAEGILFGNRKAGSGRDKEADKLMGNELKEST